MKNNDKQNNVYCKSCKSNQVIFPGECWFDECGYGYSTKLTKCPNCGKIIVVKYIEDSGLDLNLDDKYYF